MSGSVMIEDPNTRKNKPSSSAFKQQKLPAWQPILTAGTVLPTFLLIGIAFIPIGIGLLISSQTVQEWQYDYTDCIDKRINKTCSDLLETSPGSSCICSIDFELEDDFDKDVYLYYGLTNYYQNHRRYVKSRDDKQLLGLKEKLTTDCAPYDYATIGDKAYVPIAPCGAIANSLFNDTIRLKREEETSYRPVPFIHTGIAWATDKNSKFKNPEGPTLEKAFEGYTKPPNWHNYVWNLSTEAENNGYQNEQFIVWMRTAALPTFRKLYARVDHRPDQYKPSLPKGNYRLEITYSYPVTSFKGTKRVIISNTSWLGGKNPFLGVAYVLVGISCLIISGVFLFIHRKFGKSTTDLIAINQRTPYTSS